jgi:hypothetical protein
MEMITRVNAASSYEPHFSPFWMIVDKGGENCIKALWYISEGPRSKNQGGEEILKQNLEGFPSIFLYGLERTVVMCATVWFLNLSLSK